MQCSTRVTTFIKQRSTIWRKDKRTITLVECQNLISRTLICKSNKIIHKFVLKLCNYRIFNRNILSGNARISHNIHVFYIHCIDRVLYFFYRGKLKLFSIYLSSTYREEGSKWAVYYTSTQSFIITFFFIRWLVH